MRPGGAESRVVGDDQPSAARQQGADPGQVGQWPGAVGEGAAAGQAGGAWGVGDDRAAAGGGRRGGDDRHPGHGDVGAGDRPRVVQDPPGVGPGWGGGHLGAEQRARRARRQRRGGLVEGPRAAAVAAGAPGPLGPAFPPRAAGDRDTQQQRHTADGHPTGQVAASGAGWLPPGHRRPRDGGRSRCHGRLQIVAASWLGQRRADHTIGWHPEPPAPTTGPPSGIPHVIPEPPASAQGPPPPNRPPGAAHQFPHHDRDSEATPAS